MDLQEHIRDDLATVQTWVMAESTGHTDNTAESHQFYENIRDALINVIDEDGNITDDQRDEIADGAPSIWNVTRMREVIGTSAYLDEPELGDGGEDILTIAGYVLYSLAQSVVDRLMQRVAEAKESYAETE